MITVVKAGLLTTVQDLGRRGYAHLGVSRSGAVDPPSLVMANRLVGNPDTAAGLELTLTGATLRAESALVIAVHGAAAPVTVDGMSTLFATPIEVSAGAVVKVGPAEQGVRSYVAVAGGVDVTPVLGSRATDTLSGLGPAPLRPGQSLPVGTASADTASAGTASAGTASAGAATFDPPPPGPAGTVVRVRLGPRDDWFRAPRSLFATPYTLTVKSNRIGARLAGPALERSRPGELRSEGIVLGAIQVPADGQPLVFLADHPTTGGYPVVGVVEAQDLPVLAQARPGTALRFVPWT